MLEEIAEGPVRLADVSRRRDDPEHREQGNGRASNGHTVPLLVWASAPGGQVRERCLEAVLFNRLGAARTVARR